MEKEEMDYKDFLKFCIDQTEADIETARKKQERRLTWPGLYFIIADKYNVSKELKDKAHQFIK